MKTYIFTFSFLLFTVCISFSQDQTCSERSDFKTYYDKHQVEGFFLLWDEKNNSYTCYDKAAMEYAYSPASTFKILNTLIGLETGVVPDENFVIPWDGVKRNAVIWNADHDLKTAFKNSTVWYYQELARRVGEEKMNYWVEKVGYGNRDISGGIDQFWLSGGLRITAWQQLDFLKKLHHGDLPFSVRSLDITKNIMEVEKTDRYILRAKTGWSGSTEIDFGWYVGYVETADNVYYFANGIWTYDMQHPAFGQARMETSREILRALQILKD